MASGRPDTWIGVAERLRLATRILTGGLHCLGLQSSHTLSRALKLGVI